MTINSDTHPSLSSVPVSTKHTSRASKNPDSSSKPQSKVANHQPTPSDLKVYGIRVRDFAYESELPPLPTIYRHPQQIQPSLAGRLERKVTEPDGSQSQSQSQTTKKLERTVTEPAADFTTRSQADGSLDVEDFESMSDHNQHSRDRFSTTSDDSVLHSTESEKAPTTSDDDVSRSHAPDPQIDARQNQSSLPARFPSSSPLSSSHTTRQSILRSRAPVTRSNAASHDISPRINATRYQLRKRPTPPVALSSPRPSKRSNRDISSQSAPKPVRHYTPKKNSNNGSSGSHAARSSATARGKTRRKHG